MNGAASLYVELVARGLSLTAKNGTIEIVGDAITDEVIEAIRSHKGALLKLTDPAGVYVDTLYNPAAYAQETKGDL